MQLVAGSKQQPNNGTILLPEGIGGWLRFSNACCEGSGAKQILSFDKIKVPTGSVYACDTHSATAHLGYQLRSWKGCVV